MSNKDGSVNFSISKYEDKDEMNLYARVHDKVLLDIDAPTWTLNMAWYLAIFLFLAGCLTARFLIH